LGALAEVDFNWWGKSLNSGVREEVQPRDFCILGVAWGDGSGSGSGGTFEWVESRTVALPEMESWMGAWNGNMRSFASNWRELGSVVENLKREEVVFNKLRGRMVFDFMENEVTYNICKKGSYKTIYMHMLLQQLKALELSLGCRLEVIHVPGITMITQGTDGLSRGVCANGLNMDCKSFAVKAFLPALPPLYFNKWALKSIGIPEQYALVWNIETVITS
jgi:hypothetical protein